MSDSHQDPERTEFDMELQKLADEVEKYARSEAGEDTAPPPPDQGATIDDLEEQCAQSGLTDTAPPSADSPALDRVAALLSNVAAEVRRRNSQNSANQKLFDALHAELKSYKDNFLLDALQKPVIRDLIVHYDDVVRLSQQAQGFVASAEDGVSTGLEDLASNLENNVHSLVEIFHRLDVTLIEDETPSYEKGLHRVVGFDDAASPDENGMITRKVRDGFRWKNAVLRPVDVVVKKSGDGPAVNE